MVNVKELIEKNANAAPQLIQVMEFIRRDRRKIRRPKLLLSTLEELRYVIGHADVKDTLATYIYNYIKMLRRGGKSDSMANIILFGVPGTGKTHVGRILAKICFALDIVEAGKPPKQSAIPSLINNDSSWNMETIYYILLILSALYVILVPLVIWIYNAAGIWIVLLFFLVMISIILLMIAAYYYYSNDGSSSGSQRNNRNDNIGGQNRNANNRDHNDVVGGDDDYERVRGRQRRGGLDDLFDDNDDDWPAEEEVDVRDIFVEDIHRSDLTGKYQGWTESKTIEFLTKNLGKVIFFDEFYTMYVPSNGGGDSFGEMALAEINRFLSEKAGKIMMIMAGYEDKMMEGPFKVQPGLERRCLWKFYFNGYTGEELFLIFLTQVKKEGWKIEDEDEVADLIIENVDAFPFFGGDTKRLLEYSIGAHGKEDLSCISRNRGFRAFQPPKDLLLSTRHIAEGLKMLQLQVSGSKESELTKEEKLLSMLRGLR